MKVMFLIEKAGCGGAESFVRVLSEEFIKAGCRCCLCCSEGGSLEEYAKRAGMEVFRIGLGRGEFFSGPKKIAEYCRENVVDVIHAQFPREALLAARSMKYYNRPALVYTDHTGRSQGLKWQALNELYAGRFTCAAALSSEGCVTLKKNGFPAKVIKLIANGVKPVCVSTQKRQETKLNQRETLGIPQDALMISCLARFSPEKGLDDLLDAAKILKQKTGRKFRLVMAGGGPLSEHIRRRVEDESLTDVIILPGIVEDTRSLLLASDIYVSSSHSEAMSMSVLEAMSCGLPCVLTDAGAGRSLVLDDGICGFCTVPGRPQALADALARLMDDQALRMVFSAAAREKQISKYSSQRMAQSYLEVYTNGR